MTKILGIAAYYHDSSATLLVDGEIIAAAQEERFSRIKHDPAFPALAIDYCLQVANCRLEDLDAVIFYDKPMLKFERLLETYLAVAPRGFGSFLKAMPIWLKEKLYLKSILRQELRQLIHQKRSENNQTSLEEEIAKDKKPTIPKLLFSEHHQSHAASAYYPGPYDKAVVLCLDGVGEWATSSAWLGENEKLTPLWEIHFPHSLGLLYSAFTYYCGFRVNSGEYKLMGLAPYGEPKYVEKIYQHLIKVKADGSFSLNMRYFDYPSGSVMTNKAFAELFDGEAREADSGVTQKEMDLARSIQVVTEDIVLKIAHHAYQQSGCENLCLAGGVALNCVANGRILREGPFKSIWIQPAAGDAGGSLGAAMLAHHEYFQQPRNQHRSGEKGTDKKSLLSTYECVDQMQGSYLGPEFTNLEIENYLKSENLPYRQLDNEHLFDSVAELIDTGAVIGWFQGRMEFGPRALGNRSIVGDPRNQDMQITMNLKIKNRESFRPFAPAVLAENVADYFQQKTPSPYMLLVSEINPELRLSVDDGIAKEHQVKGFDKLKQRRSTLPAITHVDYSARVQTVHEETNPEFYQLIKAFKARTGIPVLINTSFNVRGEPPVCTPEDAIQCFLRTEMDYLVMNNIIIDKKQMRQSDIQQARKNTFALD